MSSENKKNQGFNLIKGILTLIALMWTLIVSLVSHSMDSGVVENILFWIILGFLPTLLVIFLVNKIINKVTGETLTKKSKKVITFCFAFMFVIVLFSGGKEKESIQKTVSNNNDVKIAKDVSAMPFEEQIIYHFSETEDFERITKFKQNILPIKDTENWIKKAYRELSKINDNEKYERYSTIKYLLEEVTAGRFKGREAYDRFFQEANDLIINTKREYVKKYINDNIGLKVLIEKSKLNEILKQNQYSFFEEKIKDNFLYNKEYYYISKNSNYVNKPKNQLAFGTKFTFQTDSNNNIVYISIKDERPFEINNVMENLKSIEDVEKRLKKLNESKNNISGLSNALVKSIFSSNDIEKVNSEIENAFNKITERLKTENIKYPNIIFEEFSINGVSTFIGSYGDSLTFSIFDTKQNINNGDSKVMKWVFQKYLTQ